MAGIKASIIDVLSRLASLTVTNGDGQAVPPHVRIWNNQVQYDADGKLQPFRKPAFFVEVLNNQVYEILGQQFRSCDLTFKIHIVQEYYDAQDGTYEQDLLIYDLRDQVISNITAFEPTACGPMEAMAEVQDYEHTNIYHYVIDFVCNFTDSIGSKYDPNHPEAYINSTPPTDLELQTTTAHQTNTTLFTVSQGKAYSTKYTATTDGESEFMVLDENGNQIIGANIIQVIKQINPLVPVQWNWNPSTSIMTLLGGISLSINESAYVTFQQNVQ